MMRLSADSPFRITVPKPLSSVCGGGMRPCRLQCECDSTRATSRLMHNIQIASQEKESLVTHHAGIWIDHRKAIIVELTPDGETIKTVQSQVEKHPERGGDSPMKGSY